MATAAKTLMITEADVRGQLLGIKGVLELVAPDDLSALLTSSIAAAQNLFEQQTHVFVYPRVIKTFPVNPPDVLGTTYDLQEDQFDYYTSSYPASQVFRLRHRPIVSVQRVAIEYGPSRTLLTYPTDWIRINHVIGTISIVPITNMGAGYQLSTAGYEYFLPMLRAGWLRGVVPIMVSIDYTAGIQNADTSPDWAQLRLTLARMAAIDVRIALAAMIPASGSRDGVSATWDNNQAAIRMLQAQVDRYVEQFREQQTGIRMVWV